jgi:putative ABC transport system substrate-binding protein
MIHLGPWLLSLLLGCPAPAVAQDPPPAPKRLGVFFWHDSPNDAATFAGIQKGLQQGGLVHTLAEQRADSDPQKAKAAFAALRAARCDLVFAMGTQAALLAKEELQDVPVVFAAVSDPVASGVVRGWDGSGTNLCGGSNWIPPQNVLDVFRLAVPGIQRLGMLRSQASGVVSAAEFATMRAHLATLPRGHLELHEAITKDAAGIGTAVGSLLQQGVDAIWIPIDITIYQNVTAVQKALGTQKVPLLTTAAAGVRGGAIVGAVVDYALHGRRTAALALDVLVRGKAPGALPVDRMRSTLVVVNLKAARESGIDLPLSLLAVADELIDPEILHAPR